MSENSVPKEKGTSDPDYEDEYRKLRQDHYNFLKKYDEEHNTNKVDEFIHEKGVPIDRNVENPKFNENDIRPF